MALDVAGELDFLFLVRQLTVQQQIGHFEEIAVLGQLFDRVAAIQQHTGIAVDVSDLALGARRGHEAGVEREYAVLLGQGTDVNDFGTERA